MRLSRKLYLLLLVLLPLASSGVMSLGSARWLSAEREAEDIERDIWREYNRLEVLQSKQENESTDTTIPRLPDQPGVAEFLSKIELAVGLSGIRCESVTVPKGQDAGQQIYKIRGKGEAGQIARFVALLEVDPRLPILDEIRIFSTKEDKTCFELDMMLFHKIGGQKR